MGDTITVTIKCTVDSADARVWLEQYGNTPEELYNMTGRQCVERYLNAQLLSNSQWDGVRVDASFVAKRDADTMREAMKGAAIIATHAGARIVELEQALTGLLDIVEAELEDDPEPDDLAIWLKAIRHAKCALLRNEGGAE